jgi:predicted ATP-grasp superfamily ATP-dependent carboligase
MKRQAKEGEFRSNLHRGGTASLIQLTAEERATAIKSAKKLGLGIAGVDLLQSNRGPLVMEVNSSPGLEGIEGATGIDIASKIIEYVERNEFNAPGTIMQDFIINNQTVSAGESKQIVLNSYELHTKTNIEIPVFVFRSKT